MPAIPSQALPRSSRRTTSAFLALALLASLAAFLQPARPVRSLVPDGDGIGYWLVASDGGIFNFSDKQFHGFLGASPPARPIVSVAVLDVASLPSV